MPKTKDVFHSPLENLSDEELIVHLRSGEEAARATLVERYFRQNELRLRSSVLPPTPFLAEWQRKEVYFKTLCHASDTYRFGNKSTFSTYFTALLKREIAEENRKESHRVEAIALSLDHDPTRQFDESLLLSEAVPAYGGKDPVVLEAYHSSLADSLRKPPAGYSKKVVDVVRLLIEGFSLPEASLMIKEKPNTVQNWFRRLRKEKKWPFEE